ncbi:MAG: transcriptional repressor [Acidilobaceae archaeon]
MTNRIEVDKVIEELRVRGYRMTPQRILLTKIVLETIEKHPSLRDLHREAQRVLPGTGISTIYNTIMMLESLGLLRVFYLDGKLYVDRYKPHVNVVCRGSNIIRDVDGLTLEDIMRVLDGKGVKVKNPLVLVIGECDDIKTQGPA